MNTETIDKLYLEISQFTSARTGRELGLARDLKAALKVAADCRMEAIKCLMESKDLKVDLQNASIKLNAANETIKSLRTWEK